MALFEFVHIPEKNIFYDVIGTNPFCMFFAGIHGHEGGVYRPLKNILNNLPSNFFSRIELLKANPPSLKLGVRGVENRDINRDFCEKTKNKSWISKEIMELIDLYPSIEYVFSFHEETDKEGYREGKMAEIETFERDPNSFYMYDAFNSDESSTDEIMPFYYPLCLSLIENGFTLYDGYDDYKDDPHETVQLNPVTNGYCKQPSNKTGFEDGSFENWVITQGMKRSFVFEIPSGITKERKQEMVKIIFQKFIIPFLNQFKTF
ncbi:hypothetical protein CO165_00265 [Candidatus Roizmanbacteria bacterium CG_4_9_14_3_um_filter_33_18]|uniref:Uncharacterized protein n=2 Tax=Candidatus Roizmaniibacteriota TaxID=1752723 RepID=A0A2M7XZ95_9BACT|nr:MAG: hypothetical protein COW97_02280 [Candidatus Roizmanbacteria bacterium CG22_combo_CG10-13_8_21_14_all_34_12]PJA56055.1 MAG: hypothetical protein CO165_00265 [Candidatus Roizmanbacteria bacterium CG_4_9_14_3_um_filter_33_18]